MGSITVSRIKAIHNGMMTRCYNKNAKDYPRYGGSGIFVSKEWHGREGIKAFVKWSLENGYNDSLSIDRIDGRCGYSPYNCRWVTAKEQCRNRKTCHYLMYKGQMKTISEWAEITGIRKDTLRNRIVKSGWSVEQAIETPIIPRQELRRHRVRGQP